MKDEKITATIPVRDFSQGDLLMVTARGVVKRTKLEAYSRPKKGGIIAVNLDKNDCLISVRLLFANQDVVLATRSGQAVRFSESAVRSVGRVSRGVRGVRLRGDDSVVAAVTGDEQVTLLTVCENGLGKRTPASEYRQTNRGGLGVINVKVTERTGKVVGVLDVRDDDEIIIMTRNGMAIRVPIRTIRCIGRNTQGVRLISLKPGDQVVSVARVVPEEEGSEEDDAPDTPGETGTALDDLEPQDGTT